MSDDDDRFNWFLEDDDWWSDLVSIIRSYVTDPVPVTLGQIKSLAGELTHLVREATATSPLDLRILEAALKTHDLEQLPLSSVVMLVDVWRDQMVERSHRYKELIDNISVGRLAAIVRPKAGTLKAGDVVGLVRLAARQSKRNKDVLEKLSLGDLTDHLSKSALRTLSIGELRTSLESLVQSGLVVDKQG